MAAMPRFVLFTPYFRARTPERQAELDLCLERNLALVALDRLVLLVDDDHTPPLEHPKLQVLKVNQRPTYRQWVELSRQHGGQAISVLANTDIHFDESFVRLAECLGAPRSFVALSRYDKSGDALIPHANPEWSQDAWALRNPADVPAGLLARLDIPLGVPRCDNKVAYLFGIFGWQVFNPHAFVRSVHVHETQQRNYDKKADLTVLGAVAYVPPGRSPAEPSPLAVDVWALNTSAIVSVGLNRSLDEWASERSVSSPIRASGVSPLAPAPRTTMSAASTADQPTSTPKADSSASASSAVGGLPVALRRRFATEGEAVFDRQRRHCIYRLGDEWLALDWLDPGAARLCDAATARSLGLAPEGPPLAAAILGLFGPPVLPVTPLTLRERPLDADDVGFWQYPCSTERQALDNHALLAPGDHLDRDARVVRTYLGLPWATYIDKKRFPDEVSKVIAPRVRALAALVRSFGWQLEVHTVCQQIHWRRLATEFAALGVSDLHLSHAERALDPRREGWPFRVHSWPLIAPNVEVPERRAGLDSRRPPEQRRWLASFIGAQMAHYRSDVRLRLLDVARASGRSDLLVDLGNEWHFNKVVYQEQVQHRPLSVEQSQAQHEATRRYNEVLSDSVFSLCPEGAGPNTLRVWESLAVGAIPVIVADDWLPPAPRANDEPALADCALLLTAAELPQLIERLATMSKDEIRRRSTACLALYARVRRRTAFGHLPPAPSPLMGTT